MALDRQSIEKKDFPVGRRGYDPEAVDAHLSTLADEISEFKRSSRKRADTLASAASDQVRAIVEAAESSAADIQREAETEAREIREEANSEAQATREEASEQAREYVSKVSESTAAMLQRIDSMQSELSGLIDALRTGGNRLDADLRLLEGNLADVGAAVTPNRYEFEPEVDPAPAGNSWDSAEPELDAASADEPSAAPAIGSWGEPAAVAAPERSDDGVDFYDPDAPGDEPAAADEHFTEETAVAEPVAAGGTSEDAEGARLIALNMALNGTPRDETARYLSENFRIADSDGLLDEVYASVDG